MRASIVLTAVASLGTTASAQCSRELLKNATAKLIAAQTAGDPAMLASLAAPTLNYTENEVATDITKGILTQRLKIDYNLSIHDPVVCGTFSEIIVTDAPHPYVIGTRMILTGDKISFIESIVTDEGDWLFNATGYLYYTRREKPWDPIPADKRDAYAVIKAAGDAYFDRFRNASVHVPAATPCARLEGGASTAGSNSSANTCTLGLPSTITVTNRRYVVDEEMGVVTIYVGFPGLDRSVGNKPMPDSHTFRVEGGLIRSIHTLSSCEAKGCGLGANFGVPPMLRRAPGQRLVFHG